LKKALQRAAHVAGLEVRRFDRKGVGSDPMHDLKSFGLKPRPMVFDVGANCGQTIRWVGEELPGATIHAFEPSPTTFGHLKTAVANVPNLSLWNVGLGAAPGELVLNENSHAVMNSFLELDDFGWGDVQKKTKVPIDTIDAFCARSSIDHIDLLKSDTQGFDLEVLRGAERMLSEERVSFIFCEVIFSAMYKNQSTVAEMLAFLQKHSFLLVAFYRFAYQRGLAGWTDALFVHRRLAPSFRYGG